MRTAKTVAKIPTHDAQYLIPRPVGTGLASICYDVGSLQNLIGYEKVLPKMLSHKYFIEHSIDGSCEVEEKDVLGFYSKVAPSFVERRIELYDRYVFDLGKVVVDLTITYSHVVFFMSGETKKDVEREFNGLCMWISKHIDDPEEDEVNIKLTYRSNRGIETVVRPLECPSWEEISSNYPNSGDIDWLLNLKNPLDLGKLVLWSGVRGTGKTYCIRALGRQWSKKAEFIYVADPEILLSDTSYFFNVLLNNECVVERDSSEDSKPPLRVVILEDAMDFLLEENRELAGSGVARLLNTAEGMLGQGMNIMLLITSNSELARIDPAFTRPGRCIQVLDFPRLNKEQATAWMNAHGGGKLPDNGEEAWSLAELYKSQADVESKKPTKIGFR